MNFSLPEIDDSKNNGYNNQTVTQTVEKINPRRNLVKNRRTEMETFREKIVDKINPPGNSIGEQSPEHGVDWFLYLME